MYHNNRHNYTHLYCIYILTTPIIRTLGRYSEKDSKQWVLHWDHQIYKALEASYQVKTHNTHKTIIKHIKHIIKPIIKHIKPNLITLLFCIKTNLFFLLKPYIHIYTYTHIHI
jgi:hypothetical protein